jgi:hypothetical protein
LSGDPARLALALQEHDTHGNADSEEEAQLCAEAHREFWMDQDEDDEPCDVWVWLRTSHERAVETF